VDASFVPLTLLANALAIAAFFGGLAAVIYLDHLGKARRRQLEHTERMRALELGQPLDDVSLSRTRALMVIGIVVPLTALGAAVGGSAVALCLEPRYRFPAWALIWSICGAIVIVTMPIVLRRFPTTTNPPAAPPTPPRSTGEALNGETRIQQTLP
jgi:hypothetical protein